MKIAYSPDADVLTIQLREGRPADSRDIAEGVIATCRPRPTAGDRDPRCFQGGAEERHRGVDGALFSAT